MSQVRGTWLDKLTLDIVPDAPVVAAATWLNIYCLRIPRRRRRSCRFAEAATSVAAPAGRYGRFSVPNFPTEASCV